jgi:2-polyprenyl-3-methyl-5-hydroxy-6-metoxy-1,4-benzoquinol methylase
MRHLGYLTTSWKKYLLRRGFACPSCGGRRSALADRKWIVTTLRRCEQCRLLFRAPTTSAAENEKIYQTTYKEGFTTELPDEPTLNRLLAEGFKGSQKDYTNCLTVLAALGGKPGDRLYDFGCSWGYGSYQFQAAGYEVESFEISVPRASFARERLGARLAAPEQLPDGRYDIFFSAHVIEHVPSVEEMITQGMRLLKPGGLFVTFTPNGGDEFRKSRYDAWHRMWGFVHPQLLDAEYVAKRFARYRYVIGTDPLPIAELKRFPEKSPLVLALDGSQLMFAVQKPLS